MHERRRMSNINTDIDPKSAHRSRMGLPIRDEASFNHIGAGSSGSEGLTDGSMGNVETGRAAQSRPVLSGLSTSGTDYVVAVLCVVATTLLISRFAAEPGTILFFGLTGVTITSRYCRLLPRVFAWVVIGLFAAYHLLSQGNAGAALDSRLL